jgi:hypothetical protein
MYLQVYFIFVPLPNPLAIFLISILSISRHLFYFFSTKNFSLGGVAEFVQQKKEPLGCCNLGGQQQFNLICLHLTLYQ